MKNVNSKLFALIVFGMPVMATLMCSIANAQTVPIEIHNCQELQNIKNNLAGNYVLANDIDCSATNPQDSNNPGSVWNNNGAGFEPIGNWDQLRQDYLYFTGSLNGAGHKVKNLYIHTNGQYAGLFGLTNGANITNLNFENANIYCYGCQIGGVVGNARGGLVDRITFQGKVEVDDGGGYVGGLIGGNSGTISNSSASITIIAKGWSAVGGLQGIGDRGSVITQSFSSGTIENGKAMGGLSGGSSGQIKDSYSSVTIRYDFNDYEGVDIGGLVGMDDGGFGFSDLEISNSAFSGKIQTQGGMIGGVLGNIYTRANVVNSFWDKESSLQMHSAGSPDSSGKTTADMTKQSTFTGLDFATVWSICEGQAYPHLQWEGFKCLKESKKNVELYYGSSMFSFSRIAANNDYMAVIKSVSSQKMPMSILKKVSGDWVASQQIDVPLELGIDFRDASVKFQDNVLMVLVRDVNRSLYIERLKIFIYTLNNNQWVLEKTILQNFVPIQATASFSKDRIILTSTDASGVTMELKVFKHQAADWVLEKTLQPDNPAQELRFGESVDIHGDRIVVGSPKAYANDLRTSGEVYIFERTDANGWQKIKKISNGTPSFGTRVRLGKDIILTTAGVESLFMYSLNNSEWNAGEVLLPVIQDGADIKNIAGVIDMDEDTIAVTLKKRLSNGSLLSQDLVYVFNKINGVWIKEYHLKYPMVSVSPVYFGDSLALNNDSVLIGAWQAPAEKLYIYSLPPMIKLTINKTGSGAANGSVTSIPFGIDCDGICSASFVQGSKVRLSQSVNTKASFTSWSTSCGTMPVCEMSYDVDKTVTANFTAASCQSFRVWTGASCKWATLPGVPHGQQSSTLCPAGCKGTISSVCNSGSFSGTTGSCVVCGATEDCRPPTQVTNLRATATNQVSVSLAWNASTDDKSKVGYRVFRNGTSVVGTTLTSFTDSGLSAGKTYVYTVQSYDSSPARNAAALSAPLSVTTQAATPPVVVVTPPTGNVGIGNVGIGNVGIGN